MASSASLPSSAEIVSFSDSQSVASSSSLPSSIQWKYDVFLSFRGPDTRRSITSQLYDTLQNKSGVKTFIDDSDLEVGDPISRTLLEAIEDSRFAIVLLSPNYASSTWCLEELAHICEYMKDDKRIFPLFYNVEPSDVRFCKKSFREAFKKHESSRRHSFDKMQQWRDALNLVPSFSGWSTQNFKTDEELVNKIVDFVCRKVQPIDIEFTLSTGYFGAYEATKQAMDKVMNALKDDEVTAVGVCGMGGVGKTTLAKHVGVEARSKGIFKRVIMATVSQSPVLKKIQQTLAEMLGLVLQKETDSLRAFELYDEITRRENILIILDDIWEIMDLRTIGIPRYDELKKCNSRVLLTTRSSRVCNIMSQISIPLHILSYKDSWSLFLKKTERHFESTNFEKVAKRVAGECKGLPIALIAVARALRDKDVEEWQKAAEQLKKSQIANPDHEDDAYRCLKLSYDYLKDENCKSCFLLCCLFPEDENILIEDMFTYAIGKGLFQHTDTIYEARGLADSVVKHLKDSSLLLEGDEDGCVRMHDVIRDTAIRIAKAEDGHGFLVKARCGLQDWSSSSHESYSAISLMRNKIRRLPEQLVCPNLQIFLLQENVDLTEIPRTFLRSANELRVLNLSGTRISLLPLSFSLLTNLQALYLDHCYRMIDFSVLGKLQKLEILSMKDYHLKELPREVEHLTNLRMLDVSGGTDPFSGDLGIVTIPSKVISKLHRLEELYMLDNGFRNWEREIEGNCLSKLCMTLCGLEEETNLGFGQLAVLPKLKILQVFIMPESIPEKVEVEPSWINFDIRIGGYKSDPNDRFDRNSRSLILGGTAISTLPDWFVNSVTSKTEKLEYFYSKGMNNIVLEFDHGRLHEVKHLRVVGEFFIMYMAYLHHQRSHELFNHFRRFDDFDDRRLHKPKHLTVDDHFLDSYVYLEELMNTTKRVQEGPVFEKLEELCLIELKHLKELCVGELPPGSLCNLKVLRIDYCMILKNVSEFVQRLPNLEKLCLDHMDKLEYVFEQEGFQPEQSKLREMHLDSVKAMKSIRSGPPPRLMFQSLKILTFVDCKMLRSVFTSDVAECLVQLEDLYVRWCPLLERVIEQVNNEKMVLPRLKNLVLRDLPKLYGASGTADIKCPSLENLIVVDCSQFSFSAASDRDGNFGSMKQFSFSDSASDYFGSKNRVSLNDRRIYKILRDKWFC